MHFYIPDILFLNFINISHYLYIFKLTFKFKNIYFTWCGIRTHEAYAARLKRAPFDHSGNQAFVDSLHIL